MSRICTVCPYAAVMVLGMEVGGTGGWMAGAFSQIYLVQRAVCLVRCAYFVGLYAARMMVFNLRALLHELACSQPVGSSNFVTQEEGSFFGVDKLQERRRRGFRLLLRPAATLIRTGHV